MPKILNYLYHNQVRFYQSFILQNFEVVAHEVNEKNYFTLHSQIVSMRCDKMLSELTHHAIKHLITKENVAHFYQDAIEF